MFRVGGVVIGLVMFPKWGKDKVPECGYVVQFSLPELCDAEKLRPIYLLRQQVAHRVSPGSMYSASRQTAPSPVSSGSITARLDRQCRHV